MTNKSNDKMTNKNNNAPKAGSLVIGNDKNKPRRRRGRPNIKVNNENSVSQKELVKQSIQQKLADLNKAYEEKNRQSLHVITKAHECTEDKYKDDDLITRIVLSDGFLKYTALILVSSIILLMIYYFQN